LNYPSLGGVPAEKRAMDQAERIASAVP
jgi:hypothetical protein